MWRAVARLFLCRKKVNRSPQKGLPPGGEKEIFVVVAAPLLTKEQGAQEREESSWMTVRPPVDNSSAPVDNS